MVFLLSVLAWAAPGFAGWAYVIWFKYRPHYVGVKSWDDIWAIPLMSLLGPVGLFMALVWP